jgi:endonuclease/exonuclease/phosphatase family metal-dependent hydrolase
MTRNESVVDEPRRLRITTYNIYNGNFFDRPGPRGGSVLEDFDGLESLRRTDVLALQEAWVGPLDGNATARNTVHEIAVRLGLDGAIDGRARFAGAPHRGGESGVALVCREPARYEAVRLPRPFWSPWARGALFARFGPWLVGTLHLEVWPIGAPARIRQMRRVLAAVDELTKNDPTPVVLAGDLNCQRGGPHELLREAGFVPALSQRVRTWALCRFTMHLDHIYVRGARVLDAGVLHAARGSDHWPVWAEIAL